MIIRAHPRYNLIFNLDQFLYSIYHNLSHKHSAFTRKGPADSAAPSQKKRFQGMTGHNRRDEVAIPAHSVPDNERLSTVQFKKRAAKLTEKLAGKAGKLSNRHSIAHFAHGCCFFKLFGALAGYFSFAALRPASSCNCGRICRCFIQLTVSVITALAPLSSPSAFITSAR